MLIYDVLHKESVYHNIANDLRDLGVKYRFKKSMFKSERPEVMVTKDISRKVFNTPLFYQPLDIVNLSSGGIVHVPVFLTQAAAFLDKYITQEGIFRKAGSQARQKELISRLDNGGNLSEKNHAIDVANCLKSFFRYLPEPLIPYMYHDLFVHCALLKNHRVPALLLACILLPPHHLNTLAFLMDFLKKVSTHETQNKMGSENLAKIIAPNIMPLRDTTITAMQNRLQMHMTIIKILIENSHNIGILPSNIAQSISTEISGSTDTGLDSFELHGKFKKNKHRSGSLTRMFNGLKKIVGKNADDTTNVNCQQSSTHSTELNMAPNKCRPYSVKKRKITDKRELLNMKKKRVADKPDKSKKLRLSLDKFVPKNRQKNIDDDSPDSYRSSYKLRTERRWSSQECDKVFIDADVNLSDDSEHNLLIKKNHRRISEEWNTKNASTNSKRLEAMNESDNVDFLIPEEKTDSEDFDTSVLNIDTISLSNDHCDGYVKIPKSEYEEIKSRVSAIESRISQEFGSIYSEESENTITHTVNKVQAAYEKTLGEAGIENTLNSDYLAKKLSKELKIRRSGEHKIIRSPSARKIGILRRRSQEKVTSKCVRRTASWHVTPKLNNHSQTEKRTNIYPTKKPTLFSNKYLEKQPYSSPTYDEIISDNHEITCLRNQVNVLISHSRMQCNISNDNNLNLSEFKDAHVTDNCTNSSVRRASSFHGKDSVNNVTYFDQKKNDLKKANSHQNITLNNDYLQKDTTISKTSNEISWKDADKYFKSASRTNTPAPLTGRASVAKLRTQNAGMVLAKAKLFDECSIKTSEFISSNVPNRKSNLDDTNNKYASKATKQIDVNTEHYKQSYKNTQICKKHSNKDLRKKNSHTITSPNASPQIKTQITDVPSKLLQEQIERNYCSTQNFDTPKQKLSDKESIIHNITAKNKTINVTRDIEIHQKENIATKTSPLIKTSMNSESQNSNMCTYKSDVSKTPHIKRPLTIKTPKSSRSLMRKPPVDIRRTPLRATVQLGTPKRQSPKSILKAKTLSIPT